jgi:class 3 adenylate cyclase
VFATLWHASDGISLAVSCPERVSHLIIVNGTARVALAPDYPIGLPPEVTAEYNKKVLEPDAVDRGFDALALMNPSVARDPVYRDWWDQAGNRGASPAMARAISELYMEADVRHLLSSVRTPTLIVHRRDTNPAGIVPVEAGRYLAEHIAEATYVELEGADQSYWLGDTEAMLDAIEEFLTGSHQAPEGDLVTATILFTDIVASTEQSARLGHRRWTALTDAHDAMVRATLGRHRGREVKTIGDAFLATFDATTRAVRAATEIVIAAHGMGLEVRAGVHTGEVEVRPDDIVGLAVTIAKRICDLAGPGEIFVSEAVKLHLTGSNIALSDQGARALKGVPDEWRLFSVKN